MGTRSEILTLRKSAGLLQAASAWQDLNEQREAVLCVQAACALLASSIVPLQQPETLQRKGRKTRGEKVGGNN